MTTPTPDYTSQHRVVALQAAVQLATLFETVPEVLACSETLLAYLQDGTLPS
jgi:hypothetical protein